MSRPLATIRGLVNLGITHVVGIPDNSSGALFDEVVRHPTIRLVTVTREGEAFALATGLWLGGASPLVVIQNTGLLESGDSLRGTAVRAAAPIPMLITGRGYAKMERAGLTPDTPLTLDLLTRADVDSVALLTEPTLTAWGIPFVRCSGADEPVAAVASAVMDAREHSRPTAVVMLRELA
ncbi:MAG: thiamine pyrophosphate-binding protein [Gemmatimonadetes bacterium]|nr:thiamine pyrophosphate-binding protein [Gemmatimonadota bacterium]MDA1102036.1 thiamine pyrophosphate-binding protein [Gemmatimonadota bacterium]